MVPLSIRRDMFIVLSQLRTPLKVAKLLLPIKEGTKRQVETTEKTGTFSVVSTCPRKNFLLTLSSPTIYLYIEGERR
jgi:hypothetical protein